MSYVLLVSAFVIPAASVIPAAFVIPAASVIPAAFVIPAASVIPAAFVIPAKAGIQPDAAWIPACAGMTGVGSLGRAIP